MLGRNPQRDRSTGAADRPGYDKQSAMFAGVLYNDDVAQLYTQSPMNLHAANKPSEHNVANMLPRIVVAQLSGQTQPRALKKTLSRSIVLRPGNQSIGGT